MTEDGAVILRDAEAVFRACATHLAGGGAYGEGKGPLLSRDARRLALLLWVRHVLPEAVEPLLPGWEDVRRAAEGPDGLSRLDPALHLPRPTGPPPPAGGAVPAEFLSFLGFFFERMKGFHAGLEHGRVAVRPAPSGRKRNGTYFTPLSVCAFMARRVLEPVLDRTGGRPEAVLALKVMDPAMGTGQFLLAAAEILAEHLAPGGEEERLRFRRRLFDRCLYGVDLDEECVEAARFLAALYTGTPDPPLPGIARGDALLEDGGEGGVFGEAGFPERFFRREPVPFEGFDALLCNPPYVAVKNESILRYKPLFPGMTQADIYLYFIHKYASRKYLRPGGAACFIVPDPLLLRANAEGARRKLLDGLDLELLLHVKGVFPRTSVSNVVFLARRPEGTPRATVQVARIEKPRRVRSFRRRGEAFLRRTVREIPLEYFHAGEGKEFRYLLTPEAAAVIRRLDTGRPPRHGPGVVIRSLRSLAGVKEAVFRGEEIGKERIRSLVVRDPGAGPPVLLGGENIAPFAVRDDGYHLPWAYVKKDRERYGRHKILMQKSTGRIVAALDDRGYVIPQSVYGIVVNDSRIGYPFLLTQLNSRLLNYYMHVMYTGYKMVQPQIELEDVRRIPVMVPVFEETLAVRRASLDTAKSLFLQFVRTDDPGWILEYAEENLKLGSQRGSAMVHDLLDFLGTEMIRACSAPENTPVSRERLEWLLDLVVYRIFGLELDEIETVEAFFSGEEERVSREEEGSGNEGMEGAVAPPVEGEREAGTGGAAGL